MREVFIILTEMDEASSDGEVRFYFTALAKQASGSAAEIMGIRHSAALANQLRSCRQASRRGKRAQGEPHQTN